MVRSLGVLVLCEYIEQTASCAFVLFSSVG